MTEKDDLPIFLQQAVVVYLNILSQYLHGGTEDKP
jgi:hypothetical protein